MPAKLLEFLGLKLPATRIGDVNPPTLFQEHARSRDGDDRADPVCLNALAVLRRVYGEGHSAGLLHPQILRRFLALVRDDVIGDLVALPQLDAGFLDCRDMDEHVLAAAIRLNKAVALRRVEPLYRTTRHVALL